MISLIEEFKKMSKPNKNKHADTENRVMVIRGEGVGRRVKWIKEINSVMMVGTKLLVVSMP